MATQVFRTHLLLTLGLVLPLCGLPACGQDSSSGSSKDNPAGTRAPLDIVNERMEAYNRHDLGAFMKTYADDVEVFTYPDTSLGRGKDHVRSIFEPMFEAGVVKVTIHHQIAKDSYVVNHETVHDGDAKTEYVSIYEVHGDLIQSVRFVRD